MKIISNKPELLDEFYAKLHREHISVDKDIQKIENAQGDITLYLTIAGLTMQTISTFLDVLTYFNSKHSSRNEQFYIHIRFKDGTIVKLENLSKEEQNRKLNILSEKYDNIDFIEIG